MGACTFLTHHARALLIVVEDPNARLRDIALSLAVTERTAYGILDDLAKAGYVVKEREGRRNRYILQEHCPVPPETGLKVTIGQALALLAKPT